MRSWWCQRSAISARICPRVKACLAAAPLIGMPLLESPTAIRMRLAKLDCEPQGHLAACCELHESQLPVPQLDAGWNGKQLLHPEMPQRQLLSRQRSIGETAQHTGRRLNRRPGVDMSRRLSRRPGGILAGSPGSPIAANSMTAQPISQPISCQQPGDLWGKSHQGNYPGRPGLSALEINRCRMPGGRSSTPGSPK